MSTLRQLLPKEGKLLYRGERLALRRLGGQEYVTRLNAKGVVNVLAVTEDRRVLLLENFRPAVNAWMIELPGGLAGDEAGMEAESLSEAARRELREETGHAADKMVFLCEGPSSPGLADEIVTFFLAWPAIRRGEPRAEEQSKLHPVPLDRLKPWLEKRLALGYRVDFRIYAALHAVQPLLDAGESWHVMERAQQRGNVTVHIPGSL